MAEHAGTISANVPELSSFKMILSKPFSFFWWIENIGRQITQSLLVGF
jgi:hypothetical protein